MVAAENGGGGEWRGVAGDATALPGLRGTRCSTALAVGSEPLTEATSSLQGHRTCPAVPSPALWFAVSKTESYVTSPMPPHLGDRPPGGRGRVVPTHDFPTRSLTSGGLASGRDSGRPPFLPHPNRGTRLSPHNSPRAGRCSSAPGN